jgi:hypothetical protein
LGNLEQFVMLGTSLLNAMGKMTMKKAPYCQIIRDILYRTDNVREAF